MKLTKKPEAIILQLQKAIDAKSVELENKNRELEIETSLEKVRTVAMGMKKADDMLSICKTISQQLAKLGVKEIRNVQTAIIYKEKGTYINYEYYANHNKLLTTEVSYINHPMSKAFVKKMLDGPNEFFKRSLKGHKVQEWYSFQKKSTNQFADNFLLKATSLNYYWYSLGPVALGISTYEPLTNEAQELFVRFRNVFELSYRRYLDIEKAEAQTREAQIEASLERIRAASLAMQDSTALSEIIYKLYGELTKLDAKLDRCFIMIVSPANKGITWWMAGQEGLLAENGFFVQTNQHASHLWYLDCWKKRRKKWTYLLEGKEKRDWDRFGFNKTELERLPEFIKKFMAGVNKINLTGSSDQFGSLVTGSFEPLPDEQQDIISRFTIAFNQAYIRFLDLKKAEAQAREAQIEAALERVRSRSMAMHTSQELNEVALELRKQMGLLGQKDLEVCAIHLYDNENSFESWSAMRAPGKEGEILQTQTCFPNKGIKIVDELMKHKKRGSKDYVLVNEGEKMVEWFKVMQQHAPELHASIMQSIGKLPVKKLKANWSVADFSGGALIMVTYGEPDVQSRNLLRRSANVFEQAYIRFFDLQKAEAQAREAQIEATLERVRSRSMAMQKSEELGQVIRVLYDQFIQLGIYSDQAGFVLDYKVRDDWFIWLSEQAGFPEQVTIPYFDNVHWKRYNDAKEKGLEFFASHLSFEEKNQFYREVFKHIPGVPDELKTFIFNCDGLEISTALLDNVCVFFVNFSGTPYSDIENAILIRFGKVFQQAYTRFLDLQKAEAQALRAKQDLIAIKEAKQKAEEALNELQATQKQLIQSEKMASLGELTAGIAHEIQNPLNFVNNFSEVSAELIEELKSQKSKLTDEEQDELLNDIYSNLEKINHHGNRASDIVKGMLQHSRSGSSVKEPTDINALADEYLRLAYHGLRAKDKSFNATMKTNFDETIGNINIIPQDIGRVILNLITNAFYVVNEKTLSAVVTPTAVKYEPTVSVSTKKVDDKVLISVKDNGNGIPQKVLDKIFQPFFTTKPTGQGTGLGLSLSYDIVKAHGGELKVVTKHVEGLPTEASAQAGSEFIILLPIT